MTTTGDLRKAGQRKQPRGSPGASLLGPTLGIHTNGNPFHPSPP